jgi:hypothetical protein
MNNKTDWTEWLKKSQQELEKAKIIDIKSKKTLANLPSPDVGKRPKLGLKGATKPVKIHEPDFSSEHTDRSLNPGLGGKYGKIHGGDPRKLKSRPHKSGGLDDEVIEGRKKRISGASTLRTEDTPKERIAKCEELLDQAIAILEKSVYNAGTHPPKGYVAGKKQAKDTPAEYDPKYTFDENKELVRMHHQDHKIPVKNEDHLHSLTVNAAKRGGHSIKE